MQKKKMKFLSCVLASAMMLTSTLYSVPVFADGEEDTGAADTAAASEDTESEDASDEEVWVDRTEEDVFAKMKIVAENANLEFWAWDESKVDESNDEKPEDVFALVNKKNGYIWWSSPINAGGDSIATPVLINELNSAMVLTAAQIEDRSTSNMRSGDSAKVGLTYKAVTDGVQVEYFYRKFGIKIPVTYTLGEDYLQVSVKTTEISEKYDASAEEPILSPASAQQTVRKKAILSFRTAAVPSSISTMKNMRQRHTVS